MSAVPVEVVPMRRELLDGYHSALDVVARERRWLAMVEAPPIERVATFVDEMLAKGWPQLVALDGSSVVGWCDVIPMRLEGFRHSGGLGMGLLAAHRGRGLGGRLLDATLRASRDIGIARVHLEVYADNLAAIRLYERHGFEREGLKRRARILDGREDDLVLMARWDPGR